MFALKVLCPYFFHSVALIVAVVRSQCMPAPGKEYKEIPLSLISCLL